MPKLLKPYYDFRGGLNTDAAPDNLLDNELERADNAVMAERGGLRKRLGTVRVNDIAYGAPVEQLIEWPRDDGSEALLAVVGTNLCKVNEQDGSLTAIQAVQSRRIGYFFLQDKFYFVDGNEFYVYDGTTVAPVTQSSETDADLAPIRRCKYLVRHTNSFRIFAAGDSQDQSAVYYSEPNDPTYFKTDSVVYPTTGDGPVKGIKAFGEALVALFEGSVWAWRGVDPATDATWKRVPTGVGTVNEATAALTPNSLTMLGPGGIYAINPAVLGFDVTILPGDGMVTNVAEDKVVTLIRGITNPDNVAAVYDARNERYMLAYRDDGLSDRSDKVLVLDWELGAFTRWTNLFITDFCYRRNQELWAATSDGFIIRMNEGFRDYKDEPIHFDVLSKQYNLDHPFHEKRLYRLYIAFRQPPQGQDVHITAELLVDGSVEFRAVNRPIRENFVWGDQWGGVWGWQELVTSRLRISESGHRVQARIQNDQIDMPTTIYGWAFEFRPKRAKGERL